MLMAALLTVSIGASARDYQLPSIGQPADNYMSPAEEEKIGRQVVALLLDRHLILEDVQLREYLTRVGTRLAAHTDVDASAFRFYPIDSSQINAFALPGGYIGINAGAGPRDSLMMAVARTTPLDVRSARIIIETAVVAVGWMFGGPLGMGTVLFSLLIGPGVQVAFRLFRMETYSRNRAVSAEVSNSLGD